MNKPNTEKRIYKTKCNRCGKMIQETYIMQDCEGSCCLDCWLTRHNLLIDYNYRPPPKFSKISFEKNPLFMGIELEIEAGEDDGEYNEDYDDDKEQSSNYIQNYAYDIMKDYPCYVKYDGSLNVSGMEIVTHPQTVKHHKRIFNWRKLLKRLEKDGFTSYSNNRCGLHIHLSKSWFKPEDYLKFNIFFDKNFSAMKRFSKRTRINYCNKIRSDETRIIARDKKKTRIQDWYDHYKCVYFGNTQTIEIRIYRGTLDIKRFNATLDITEALSYFIKSYSLAFFIKANKKQLWYTFLAFMKQSKKYNRLLKYLEKEKLLYCKLNKIPRTSTVEESKLEERDLLSLMGNESVNSYLKDKILKKIKYYFDDFEDYTIVNRNDVYYLGNNFIPIKFGEIVFNNNIYNARKRYEILTFFLDYSFTVILHDGDKEILIRDRYELAESVGVDIRDIRRKKEGRDWKMHKQEERERRQNHHHNIRRVLSPNIGIFSPTPITSREWEVSQIRTQTQKKLAKRANKHYIFKIRNQNQ